MKDKNTLCYHRMMNQCPFYKGKDLLKMYPTQSKSETKEFVRLGVKFGKTIPSQNKCLDSDEANLPPKQAAPNLICLETRVTPPPQLRHVKEDIFIISNDDDLLFTPHKNKGKQPSVTKLSISKNNSCVQHALKEKPKILTQTKTATPLFGSQSTTDLSTTNPQQNLMDLSKVEVEAKALAIVETFTIKGDCEFFFFQKNC
jgi:hypothetical protein